MKKVCVFCGANSGTDPAHAEAARVLGHAIAARGLGLVYGGGKVGLMGIVADAALEECRRVYSWSRVGRQIMDVYAAVAGTKPDLHWPADLPVTPCRFRAEPHLL